MLSWVSGVRDEVARGDWRVTSVKGFSPTLDPCLLSDFDIRISDFSDLVSVLFPTIQPYFFVLQKFPI
jgi:hypothetical protein